jgi:hypothetical protein
MGSYQGLEAIVSLQTGPLEISMADIYDGINFPE